MIYHLPCNIAWYQQRVPGSSISGRAKHLFPLLLAPLLHLTCLGGALDDKDLAVSFNHGNTWLFDLGIIMGEEYDLLGLNKKFKKKKKMVDFLWQCCVVLSIIDCVCVGYTCRHWQLHWTSLPFSACIVVHLWSI